MTRMTKAMADTLVMDEVMAEAAIGGVAIQHRLRTRRRDGPGGYCGGFVFVVRTPKDVMVLDREEMRRLVNWCEERLAVGVVEEWIRRYRGWI
jgi:hypothetical protein